MSRLLDAVRVVVLASRPYSWVNTGLPFLAAAWAVERGATPAIVVGALYFLVPYNVLLYGVNDVFDYASDVANPRKGSIEGGLVPPDRRGLLWVAIALSNGPVLLLLAALLLVPGSEVSPAQAAVALGAVLVAVVAAVVYSAPPLRTKERPFLDSLTSASHFVLPAACGALVAGASLAALPWVALGGFVAWGVASHALGAIQDIVYDRAAGIGSIAVALGERRTAALSLLGYATAALAVATLGSNGLLAAAVLALYLPLPVAVLARPGERSAHRAWRAFLRLNLLAGFLLTLVLLRAWDDRVAARSGGEEPVPARVAVLADPSTSGSAADSKGWQDQSSRRPPSLASSLGVARP